MQSKTKNSKTRAQVEALALRAFPGVGLAPEDGALREHHDGWFNAVYELRLADGRSVILKIAPPPGAEVMQYERGLMATEVATMRLLRADPAILVPEVLFHDSSHEACDADWFVMEKMPGLNLDHARPRLPLDVLAGVDREIGAMIRAVNQFTGDWFGCPGNPALRGATWREAFLRLVDSVLVDASRKAVSFARPETEIRALVDKHADSLDEVRTPRLVHWDAWDPNFFVADGRVTGLIDFERALWADPLMEAQFRPLSWGAGVTEAMRGYGKTVFSADETRRCRLYTLHLALVMHTECFYRHYGNDEILEKSRGMIVDNLDWLDANRPAPAPVRPR